MFSGGIRRRGQRGAAAVEAALVISAILVPLMLGVLYYGMYFWILQSAPMLDPNLDQAEFVGEYCPNNQQQLLTRVREAALVAIGNVDDGSGLPITLSSITATFSSYVPNGLGVDIRVSVTSSVMSETSILPLPNNGNIVNDSVIRLQNVHYSTGSC